MRLASRSRWIRARKCLALACALAYTLAAFGISVPVPRDEKLAASKSSKPYPCQYRRCGCRSAEQCRTQCCCSSRTERDTRAKEIRGPSKVKLDLTKRTPLAAVRGCCSGNVSEATSDETPDHKPSDTSPNHDSVAVLDVLKCSGTSLLFVTVLPSCSPNAGTWKPVPCVTGVASFFTLLSTRPADRPPIPPPRTASV